MADEEMLPVLFGGIGICASCTELKRPTRPWFLACLQRPVATWVAANLNAARNLTSLDQPCAGVMWTPDVGWVMYLSKLQRMNTGPSEQLAKFGRTGLSVQWLYQLFLALECDVWIGTRNSNWNRLIDEMRCALPIGAAWPRTLL